MDNYWWLSSGIIKHGWLENPPSMKVSSWEIPILFCPFSSTRCLITGGYMSSSGGQHWTSRNHPLNYCDESLPTTISMSDNLCASQFIPQLASAPKKYVLQLFDSGPVRPPQQKQTQISLTGCYNIVSRCVCVGFGERILCISLPYVELCVC